MIPGLEAVEPPADCGLPPSVYTAQQQRASRTAALRQIIRNRLRTSMTHQEIADDVGVSRTWVQQLAGRNG